MLFLAVVVAACGGGAADGDSPATTDGVATGTESNGTTADAPATTQSAENNEQGSGSGNSGDLPVLEGGSAAITIAGETVEFDFFVCFYGDALEEFFAEGLSMGALGQSTDSAGTEHVLAVSSLDDSVVGTNYTVLYTRTDSDGTVLRWQRVGADGAEINGDEVTSQGDFRRIIGSELTDETDPGQLNATCSPNSLGR
ncbi:MAG: hypothetical protein WBM90_03570 [Acidimicrobiia bacterium]